MFLLRTNHKKLNVDNNQLLHKVLQSAVWACNIVLIFQFNSQLGSSHSPQVPPSRQCHSPCSVTIFTLPVVPLCPLQRNGNENFKVIQNPEFLPDHPQNRITGSLCHARHTPKISEISVHNIWVILLTHRQTNKNRQKHYLLGGGNQELYCSFVGPIWTKT